MNWKWFLGSVAILFIGFFTGIAVNPSSWRAELVEAPVSNEWVTKICKFVWSQCRKDCMSQYSEGSDQLFTCISDCLKEYDRCMKSGAECDTYAGLCGGFCPKGTVCHSPAEGFCNCVPVEAVQECGSYATGEGAACGGACHDVEKTCQPMVVVKNGKVEFDYTKCECAKTEIAL